MTTQPTDIRDGTLPVRQPRFGDNVTEFYRTRKDSLLQRLINSVHEAHIKLIKRKFGVAYPYFHDIHLLHPNPIESRELARAALTIRREGWRGAEWIATFLALDLDNNQQYEWAASCIEHGPLIHVYNSQINYPLWDVSVPHRVPSFIPKGTPSEEQHEHWQPDTTTWDIEDAAMHELELGTGGLATLALYDQWITSDPKRQAAVAARSRVHTYLSYHYARADGLPDDPYDPNEWGHDTRLKTLVLHDINSNENIRLTPDFDPETFAYTTGQPIAPPISITATPRDPLAARPAQAYSQNNGVLTVTVTSRAGETQDYTVTVQG